MFKRRILQQIDDEVFVNKKVIQHLKELAKTIDSEMDKYKLLFTEAAEPIILLDEKGNILEFNKQAHISLGYTREEYASLKNISLIDALETEEGVCEHCARIIEAGGGGFTTQHKNKHGTILQVFVNTVVIGLNGNKFLQSIFHYN